MPNETHRASLRYKISEFFRILLGNIDNPVLIHYGAYETIFLKRLARRYPDSTPDSSSISTLIARRVNLLGITYSQIYFPTYSNRLKEVARYLGFQWSHPSSSGLQSLIWRQQWEETADPSIKQTIITYNKEDFRLIHRHKDFSLRILEG